MKDSGTKIEKKSSSFDFIIECRLHYAVAKNATETSIENVKNSSTKFTCVQLQIMMEIGVKLYIEECNMDTSNPITRYATKMIDNK